MKVNFLTMKFLRNFLGVSQMDRVRNEVVRSRAGMKRELVVKRMDQRVLRWIVHMERKDECHMARLVSMAEASGRQVWGRQRLDWMDGWCEGGLHTNHQKR